jgi:RNase H-fold protein (predicted Holliday junction resolvase)
MAVAKLAKLLVSPSKIASTLNWKKITGAVLSLDIHKDRIGMAIASHPTMNDGAEALEPIYYHFQHGKLPDNTKQKLEEIVQHEHDICGIVVSWPLQTDTGHMGASCGRTIHVVEELLEDTNVFAPNRPLCFWDSQHTQSCGNEDEWGRCSQYSRTSSKHEHLASVEQYSQDENVAAIQVWNDFVRVHWPTAYQQQRSYHSDRSGGRGHWETNANQSIDYYDEENALAF